MRYGLVPGLKKRVSRLVQGTMYLSGEEVDEGLTLLDTALDLGCNTFDCAHIYGGGDCERVVGQWLESRGVREEIVLITKGAHFNSDRNRLTPFDIASDLHDSLARLRTDYIDLYLLHRDDPSQDVGPIMEALNEHVAEGRIRALGASNWTHERMAAANDYAAAHDLRGFVATSPQFSLAEQVEPPWPGCVGIGGDEGESARTWYLERQMPAFTWSSLAGGFLSGAYTPETVLAFPEDSEELCVRCFRNDDNVHRLRRALALAAETGSTVSRIALAWLLHQTLTVFPLVGSKTPGEVQDNMAAIDVSLSPKDVAWLNLEREDR
ncbi:MAG: aldo/keto reductase [bacterium]|nr:aldo/keto reductase [bacterium]